MPNILGCFASIALAPPTADQETKDLFEEQGRVFRAYVWGEHGICDALKKLEREDYGNDLVLILFQFYVNPIPILAQNLKEIEAYRKKERSIGIPIIVNDDNFFSKPESERYDFLKQSILQKLDLLAKLIKRRKLDTKIDLLKSDVRKALS